MKPSWMPSGLDKNEIKDALGWLDKLGALSTVRAKLYPAGKAELYCAPPGKVLVDRARVKKMDVTEIDSATGRVTVRGGRYTESTMVLVAAGVWSSELVPALPKIQSLQGTSFLFAGELDRAHIRPWAPYKQVVVYPIAPGIIWAGDGTAILRANYTQTRIEQSRERCESFLRDILGTVPNFIRQSTGLRPYVEGHKAGYLAQVGQRAWVSTGGAKNGTILAAIQAQRFITAIGEAA